MDFSSFFEDHGDLQVEMAYTTSEPTKSDTPVEMSYDTTEPTFDSAQDLTYTYAAAATDSVPRVFTTTPQYPIGFHVSNPSNISPIPTHNPVIATASNNTDSYIFHSNAPLQTQQRQVLETFDAKQHARLASGIDASLFKSFQKLAALLKYHNELESSDPPDVDGAKELAKRIDRAVKDSEVDVGGNLVLKGKKRN